MEFGPLQRHQSEKPGYRGVASPATFRLQGFSPSCRFASSRTFRPCFMPVALMGFSLQGFFLLPSLQALSSLVPFMVLAVEPVNLELPPGPPVRKPYLQGFSLCKNSTLDLRGEPQPEPLPSWVSPPLGISPPNRPTTEVAAPLSSFACLLLALACARTPRHQLPHRVFTGPELACLLRDCRPFWSFAPFGAPQDSSSS